MGFLKEKRMEKGLSQKQVAELSGISRYRYLDIETNGYEPSVKTAKKIANALGFDWKWFYEDETPPKEEAQ